jgi:hypothetical protein
MSDLPKVNNIPALAARRLVCVETEGEGTDLVSLTHRCVLATGDGLASDDSVPHVTVGPEQEREACRLAGVPYDGGHPGWPVLLAWLDRQYPAPAGDGRLAGLVERLTDLADDDGGVQPAVDELCYDFLGTGKHVSTINNQGIEAQAEALAERIGLEAALHELRAVLDRHGGELVTFSCQDCDKVFDNETDCLKHAESYGHRKFTRVDRLVGTAEDYDPHEDPELTDEE